MRGLRVHKNIAGDPRFKDVGLTRSLIAVWAQKEFRNLKEAEDAKVNVPKPIAVKSNVVVMGFCGTDGINMPSLKQPPKT